MEQQNSTRCDNKIAHLELVAMLIDLLLAAESIHTLLLGDFAQEKAQVVDLTEMERANRVKIVLHQVHFLDKLWDELDQRVKFVANFPASLTHHFSEQVAIVRDADHWVSELCLTENLRVSEGVLVRHQDLEIVVLDLVVHHLRRDRSFRDEHLKSD